MTRVLAHTVMALSPDGDLLTVPAGTKAEEWPADVLAVVHPSTEATKKSGLAGKPVLGPEQVTNPVAWDDDGTVMTPGVVTPVPSQARPAQTSA